MSALIIACEPLEPIWNEIMAIAEEHWQETEAHRHGQKFVPDRTRYIQRNEAGDYLMFTLRSEGRLVGYAGVYIIPSMHTQQLIAVEDTYFLLPAFRKGRNALVFLKKIEQALTGLGCKELCFSTKLSNPRAERILEYLGHRFVEKRWSKQLNQETV